MNTDPWSRTVAVGDDEQPSMAIIDAVARIEGAEPIELPPLYDSTDPDVLDAVSEADGFTSLEFTYCDRPITLSAADGGLEVRLGGAAPAAEAEDAIGVADGEPTV